MAATSEYLRPLLVTGARRIVTTGGSIQLNGEKLSDPKAEPAWESGAVLKLDKKRSVRLA